MPPFHGRVDSGPPRGGPIPSRRRAGLTVLVITVVAAVVLASPAVRSLKDAARPSRGDVSRCVELSGDAARTCYAREVGRQLAVVGGRNPNDIQTKFDFASASSDNTALLCDLHSRAGNVNPDTPSWIGWNEPVVASSAQL